MNQDFSGNIAGLIRHANALNKLATELRFDVCEFEYALKKMTMRRWQFIMLHHSLTKDGETVSWQAIRRYHKETMGWDDIGYHFGIELVNSEYEIFMGRPLDREGAHCSQEEMNHRSIGICFVGNFDDATVPTGQWQKGLELVRGLRRVFDIPLIVAHRDYAPKSCPGKMFDLDQFRKELG